MSSLGCMPKRAHTLRLRGLLIGASVASKLSNVTYLRAGALRAAVCGSVDGAAGVVGVLSTTTTTSLAGCRGGRRTGTERRSAAMQWLYECKVQPHLKPHQRQAPCHTDTTSGSSLHVACRAAGHVRKAKGLQRALRRPRALLATDQANPRRLVLWQDAVHRTTNDVVRMPHSGTCHWVVFCLSDVTEVEENTTSCGHIFDTSGTSPSKGCRSAGGDAVEPVAPDHTGVAPRSFRNPLEGHRATLTTATIMNPAEQALALP